MKEAEDDVKLMTWIAWGVEVLFKEKRPKEVFNYMKDPDLSELRNLIRPQRNELKDLSGHGFELDTLVAIYSANNQFQSFLNVENQISYNEEEVRNRSLAYLCALQFNLNRYFDKHNYKNMQESNSVWILPNAFGKSNLIENHKFQDIYTSFNAEIRNDSELEESEGNVDKLNAYYFFLGPPDKIIFEDLNDESLLKQAILLYLLDGMFGFGIPNEKRFEILDLFYLTNSSNIVREVEKMAQMFKTIDDVAIHMFGKPYSEVEADLSNMRTEIKELKQDNTEMADELKDALEEIESLKAKLKKYEK